MTVFSWLDILDIHPHVERLAIVLMHSWWQFLLVINVVAVILAALSRAAPRYRYAIALTGMLLLPLFPVTSWALVESTRTHAVTTFDLEESSRQNYDLPTKFETPTPES